jgi:hypothetical protein
MLRWFKRKTAKPIDQMVKAMYGDSPPDVPPDLEEAIRLAHGELLKRLIDENEVRGIATELRHGPIPYSTHGLALCTSLNFFRRREQIDILGEAQLMARMMALEWAQDKKIPPTMLAVFEQSLYELYR